MFTPCWSCGVYHNRKGRHICWVCEQLAYVEEVADKPRGDTGNRRGRLDPRHVSRKAKRNVRGRTKETSHQETGSDVGDPEGGGS